jgi:toluene monooxygenase system ferredoxin subunit
VTDHTASTDKESTARAADAADVGSEADGEAAAEFHRVCDLDELWQGEMAVFEVASTKILMVHTESGVLRAVQYICPHQSFPLSDGELEGDTLVCLKHMWEFDVVSGCGINPTGAAITLYPVKVENDQVYVSVAGVQPKYARP